MSTPPAAELRATRTQRFLTAVERTGNALPHPATMFALRAALIVIASDVIGSVDVLLSGLSQAAAGAEKRGLLVALGTAGVMAAIIGWGVLATDGFLDAAGFAHVSRKLDGVARGVDLVRRAGGAGCAVVSAEVSAANAGQDYL